MPRAAAAFAASPSAGSPTSSFQYITTPEEYDRQHYEGGSTFYGPAQSAAITDSLVGLAQAMRAGKPAPAPAPFDPRNGIEPTGEPLGKGATSATAVSQPIATPPGAQAVFKWKGGPLGLDRRLDKRFIAIERRSAKRWRRVADDLGLAIVWTVDDAGVYDAHWQVPRKARGGPYRIKVTANRYRLRSKAFRVSRTAPAQDTDPTHPAAMFAPITNR